MGRFIGVLVFLPAARLPLRTAELRLASTTVSFQKQNLTRSMLLWLMAASLTRSPGWALVISEIHYHPPPGQESLEFIELTNDAFSPEDISGWAFVEGVSFVFPPRTVLRGGEALVVCADVDAVNAHYDPRRAIGNFTGSLDGSGERVTLTNHAGVVIQSVRYSDRGKWPPAADGAGHSLILKNIHANSSDPQYWDQSPELGGSPAEPNFPDRRIGYRDTVYFGLEQPWRYRKGTAAFSEPPTAWRGATVDGADFDDSDWAVGLPGFGIGDDDDTTVLEDMRNGYSSVALRLRFTLTDAELNARTLPVLEINYDDGFCAFLNGVEFARNNCPDDVVWNATATISREARERREEFYKFPRKAARLGENVLAIVGYNVRLRDLDFSLIPRVLLRHFDEVLPAEEAGVVLNELFRGAGGSGWLELFNTETSARDLSGWTLDDGPHGGAPYTFADGMIIGPGRFLVLGEEETGLALSAPEVALFLHSPSGFVLAGTVFDRAPPPALGDAPYAEARFPDGGRLGWVTPTPTAGKPNEAPVVSDLVINEILYHPPEGRKGEFIELYHRGPGLADGGAALDLSGFRFEDGIDYPLPEGTTIAPGEYLVVAQDPDFLAEHYGLRGALGPYQGVLSNRGERLQLVDSLGNLVDEVRYYDGGHWPIWADGGGSSLELIDPRQTNDLGGAWGASDETQKAPWEEHNFRFSDPPNLVHSELRFFLVERGACLVDDVELTKEIIEFDVLIETGETWRFRKGTGPFSEPAGAWYGEDFDDTSWEEGPSGFGVGDDDDRTVLDDMRSNYTSLAVRKRVLLTAEQAVGPTLLGLRFDDGMCAFINGQRIACENVSEPISWKHTANGSREAEVEVFFEIPEGLLRPGENTVAVVGFNRTLLGRDFSLDPRLLRVVDTRKSDNLVANGGFETGTSPWNLRGTHRPSRRTETDSFSGVGSLELIGTSKGDGQCNGAEIDIEPPLEVRRDYGLSLATRWQRGGSLLLASGGWGRGNGVTTPATELAGNSLAARVRLTIPYNLGSPGEENSARRVLRERTGVDNLGPLFAKVEHTPPIPDPETVVMIRAHVVDADGVSKVRIHFGVANGPEEFHRVDLLPAGNDVFENELPPTGLRSRVLFYFEAEDGTGARSLYPANAPEQTLVYVTGGGQEDSLHIANARLRLNFDGIMSNELVPGTVVHDEEIFYNVGMRYRGSPWGRPTRESLRLRFPKDHLFKGTRRDINLSNRDRNNDGPAHFMVGRNGTPEHPAPGSDYKYITARVNGGSWGVPGIFEPYDRRFITKWFGEEAAAEGVLVKGNGRLSFNDACTVWRWDQANLDYRDSAAENYRFYFSHRLNHSRDRWEPFVHLTALLDAGVTDDSTLDATFESVIDFESFFRTLGPRMMVADDDALFVGNGHNGFLFWDPTEELWHYLSVDFGGWKFEIGGLLQLRDRNLQRLMRRPKPQRLYYNMLHDYMHGYWSAEASGPYFEALEEMANVDDNGGIARSRRVALSRLEPFVEAPFLIHSRSGDGPAIELPAAPPQATLEGEAPVTVASFLIQVDGEAPQAFAPVFNSPTEWTGEVAIREDSKELQLLGFDRGGALVETAGVTLVVAQPSEFVRGDVDGNSKVNIRDPLVTLAALFRGGSLFCPDAADVNDDGRVDLTDVLAGLEYVFRNGKPPPAPFPTTGPDPSKDGLDCRR